jgi:protein-disulfide isomerase
MNLPRLVLAAFLAATVCTPDRAAAPVQPKIDKQKFQEFLRYAEGYTEAVKFSIDDPVPSAYPGFWRVIVHVSLGERKAGDRLYYVTAEGQNFISGTLWELGKNPFADILAQLPTNAPSFGPADAKVSVVIFSDFQCPYCREFAKTVRDNIPKKYPNEVRVVFVDFPIDAIHPWARAASEAAHCLADQKPSAFWDFHDWIFEHQGEVNAGNLREKTLTIAKEQNIDASKVGSCIDSHATAGIVEEAVKQGRLLQVQQTPTEFVNGRLVGGAVPWKGLDSVIELELKRPKDIPGPSSGTYVGTVPGK